MEDKLKNIITTLLLAVLMLILCSCNAAGSERISETEPFDSFFSGSTEQIASDGDIKETPAPTPTPEPTPDPTPDPTPEPTPKPTVKPSSTPKSSASPEQTVKPTSDKPYLIRINRAQNCVTVYRQSEGGKYDEPVCAFICSTGTATPIGTFKTTDKYVWRALFNDCYGQYATRITGTILFHSVPYFTQNKADLEYEEYNKLGTAASMGCIRLTCRDAKWIYDNCPKGTTVEIYDDAETPGPLGKPGFTPIDPESPNRGWDPTDPDPKNPWKH